MEGNDELGLDQSTALLRVGEHPDAAEYIVRKASPLKKLLRLVPRDHADAGRHLSLEHGSILCHLVRRQLRDPDRGWGRARRESLQDSRRRWRRCRVRGESLEPGQWTLLQGYFW